MELLVINAIISIATFLVNPNVTNISTVVTYILNDLHFNPILATLLYLLNWVFSRLVLTLNMLVFIIIFHAHFSEFNNMTTFLANRQSLDFSDINIGDLCYSLLQLKSSLELSIRYVQPIYTLGTFIGTVGIGFFVQTLTKDSHLESFTIVGLCIYALIQIFALLLMYFVNEQKEVLKVLIQSSRFTHSFLQGIRKLNTDYRRVNKMKLTRHQLKQYHIELNYHATHWMILNSIINSEWDTFQLFGFTFEDGQAIQKGIAFSAFILSANQFISNY